MLLCLQVVISRTGSGDSEPKFTLSSKYQDEDSYHSEDNEPDKPPMVLQAGGSDRIAKPEKTTPMSSATAVAAYNIVLTIISAGLSTAITLRVGIS